MIVERRCRVCKANYWTDEEITLLGKPDAKNTHYVCLACSTTILLALIMFVPKLIGLALLGLLKLIGYL